MTTLSSMGYYDFDRNFNILNKKGVNLEQAIGLVVDEYAQEEKKGDKIWIRILTK